MFGYNGYPVINPQGYGNQNGRRATTAKNPRA